MLIALENADDEVGNQHADADNDDDDDDDDDYSV